MATKGYNSYHGRSPAWKKILIVILVLLLLGGGAFLYCQNHLVYDDNGKVHLELPFFGKKEEQPQPQPTQDPDDVDFRREEPQGPVIERIEATELAGGALEQDVSALLAGEEKTIVVNAKLADGSFTYQPAFPVEGASTGSVISRENLKKLGDSDKYIVARICALGDSAYAKAHVNEAGLLRRSDKWLWYDYGSRCWLDLTKPLTQSYVKQVCKDLADLGVDEIVLERFGWPAVGNMGAMVVPEGTDKPAVISAFLKELRETLPKTTAVSVLIGTNAPENSGLTPAVLAEFDRVYTDPENVDVEALAATMPADFKREAQLVQLVTAAQLAQMNQTTPYTGSYVLVNG